MCSVNRTLIFVSVPLGLPTSLYCAWREFARANFFVLPFPYEVIQLFTVGAVNRTVPVPLWGYPALYICVRSTEHYFLFLSPLRSYLALYVCEVRARELFFCVAVPLRGYTALYCEFGQPNRFRPFTRSFRPLHMCSVNRTLIFISIPLWNYLALYSARGVCVRTCELFPSPSWFTTLIS